MKESRKHKMIGKADQSYKFWYGGKENKFLKRKFRKAKKKEGNSNEI